MIISYLRQLYGMYRGYGYIYVMHVMVEYMIYRNCFNTTKKKSY